MSSRSTLLFRAATHIRHLPTNTGVLWGTCCRRKLVNWASRPRPPLRRARLFGTLALTGTATTSAYFYLHRQPILLDTSSPDTDKHDSPTRLGNEPLSSLIRTYIVYSMCSIPWLVDYSPKVLDVLMSVPVLKQVAEAFVRPTFFAQFVGGETALETLPVLERLRAENKGAMLHFGAEVDESEAEASHAGSGAMKRTSKLRKAVNTDIVDEFIRCIDAAGDFEDSRLTRLEKGKAGTGIGLEGRKTSVAVKLTALIPDPNTFINFSRYLINTRSGSPPSSSVHIPFPGIPRPTDLDILSSDPFDLPPTCPLTREDLESLNSLKEELFRMCKRAQERGVVVCIDSEHSWYQPAIEAFQLALMREFNHLERLTSKEKETRPFVQPLIYGTFQTYLRRASEHLEQSLRDAEEGRYALGVKLVRGAYHGLETSSHLSRKYPSQKESASGHHGLSISPETLPPVWQSKAETDECFNKCARMLVKKVAASITEEKKFQGGPREGYVSSLGLIFGTHNPGSCELVLDALVDEGLATRARQRHDKAKDGVLEEKVVIAKEAARRIAVGQLYGMCDVLSSSLASRTSIRPAAPAEEQVDEPIVIKYIPYGPLERVMPYLGRRALENRSVLSGSGAGGARDERQRAWKEIAKRVKGWFGLR